MIIIKSLEKFFRHRRCCRCSGRRHGRGRSRCRRHPWGRSRCRCHPWPEVSNVRLAMPDYYFQFSQDASVVRQNIAACEQYGIHKEFHREFVEDFNMIF